jgi:NAD(P)-dependent dehydrogenase (short-subunit alcohol dehydrogenase family)
MLKNRVAIITGGSRGIGKGIALKFSEQGCISIIADMRVEEGKKTVGEILEQGGKADFALCNVADSAEVQDMVDRTIKEYGKIDILVNNAGISKSLKSIVDVSEEEWDAVLAVNLKGAFLCCKAVVPHMKERRYGKIINVSSMAAISPPAPLIHYSSAKAGLLGLTLDLALELAPSNITVNAILPGGVATEMWEPLIPPGVVDKEDFFRQVGKTVCPMQRMGTPEELAGVALFLASELSAYVTGDRILVGGGYPLASRL